MRLAHGLIPFAKCPELRRPRRPPPLGHETFGDQVPHSLGRNPLVSWLKPRAERTAWLPAQLLPDEPIIGVATSHPLRSGHVLFANPLAGDVRHKVDKLVD